MPDRVRPAAGANRLPPGIWALGFVSLFMDVSSEMIHSLLPVFLVGTLGVGAMVLGMIEGIAEASTSIAKLFSGVWSDQLGRRKPLALLGYGLAALTKPLFPLADSALTVLSARFIDRIGKGLRGAPRDALVADLTPPTQLGAAYGLRQSLDTVGAFTGPLVAVGLMLWFRGNIRAVFWTACVPGVIAVSILAFGVREGGAVRPERKRGLTFNPFAGVSLAQFSSEFRWVLLIVVSFTLARFSEAFLILRVLDTGVTPAFAPLALVAMNVAYAASAYPFGRLSDQWPRGRLLMIGCLVLVLADFVLAVSTTRVWVFVGIALWGVHMGLTEGLLAALTAAAAPAALRGTAFGLMNLVRGLSMLIASALAGTLWQLAGEQSPFLAGAIFSLITLALVALHSTTRRTVR